MVGKYYLYKVILRNNALTGELKDEPELLFSGKMSQQDLYEQRVQDINANCLAAVKSIDTLTGAEANSLMQQKDRIIGSLLGHWTDIALQLNMGHSFAETLADQLDVNTDKIHTYETAEKSLVGERVVLVSLDGNHTKLIKDGKPQIVQTRIKNNFVTIEKCREIVTNLANYHCHPKKVCIDLSIFTSTPGNECGDFPEECLLNKKVFYDVKKDKMLIWQDENPVYENDHGVICDDPVTLADCYC